MPEAISQAPTATFPLVLQPASGPRTGDLSIAEWAADAKTWIEAVLHEHGAILFRGLPLSSAEDFSCFVSGLDYENMDYAGGTALRDNVASQVMTASTEPPEVSMEPHNEMAYATYYPSKILFFCETPPTRGGETPIADVRQYAKLLDPELRRKIERTGVRYRRYLPHRRAATFISWQQTFFTEDKEEVVRILNEMDYDFHWDEDDNLTYSNVLPATVTHPKTGEEVWFNQITAQHASYFQDYPDFGQADLDDYEHAAFHSQYGDGTEVPADVVAHIRQKIWSCAVAFTWQQGDVLILDNLLVQHGRMSFEGARRILVGLCK